MAENAKKFKLPQSNRARILMIVVIAAGVLLVGFSLFRLHRSRQKMETGSAALSRTPGNIQSLPGGKQVSQQYLKVLLQQQTMKADNALKTGQTSIPTMVNTGQTYIQTRDFTAKTQAKQCNCPLPGMQGSGASLLDQLAATRAISPSVAADLQRLQNQGASVSDYANELQKLVAEGKLTPEQAAKLLAAYRAKHGGAAAGGTGESPADIASRLLASGAITPQTAQELAQLNGKKLTPAQYQAALQRMVAEGKLTPEQARQLMAAYRAKHGGDTGTAAGISESPSDIASDLLASGAITPQTAQELAQLNSKKLTPAEYQAELQKLVREGKLTPEQARQLLASYKAHHAAGTTEGNESPADVANQLLASGAITPQTAQELAKLNKQHLTPEQYRAALQRLVAEGKLTPAQARQLMAAYNRKHGLATSAAVGSGDTPDSVASRLLASGAITPATERELAGLNNQNLTPEQYQARLARMVAEGKLTPEQARALAAAYRRTHGGAAAGTAATDTPASVANRLLASGAITPATAKELAALNSQNLTPEQYQARLARLVAEGKLTPAQARQLLAAYKKTHVGVPGTGTTGDTPASVANRLLASGAITPATAKELAALNNQNLTPEQYRERLARLVAEGKLTPAQAAQLLAAYKKTHASTGSGIGDTPSDIASRLLASGSISPATARELATLNHSNLTPEQYRERLAQLAAEGKLTPAQAQALMAAYNRTHGAGVGAAESSIFADHNSLLEQLQSSGQISGQTAAVLKQLSDRNASASDYATQLTSLVRSGALSPSLAQRLLSAYIAKHGSVTLSSRARANPQIAQLERLQQQQQLRVQQQVLAQLQQQQALQQAQKKQQQLQALESAMRSQSSALFSSWAAPSPSSMSGGGSDEKGKGGAAGAAGAGRAAAGTVQASTAAAASGKTTIPLVKAGSIMFAVLNTAIDSDKPGVVMATIVSGKFKGAKLMGGLTLKTDRVELSFTSLTMESWPKVVTIKAVAINPDTARTAIASSVNYHYLSRYGSLMASSFLEGYGQAIENSGNTTISGDGTVTSTSDTYSPSGRFLIALGNVGSKLSSAAQENFNRKPTVKVDAGVSLGILFEGDVATPDFLLKKKGGTQSAMDEDMAGNMGNEQASE